MPTTKYVVARADEITKKYNTRDPFKLVNDLGISLFYCDFLKQKGAYKVILRNRFIFLNQNLDEVSKKIVLLHEIGHDILHRSEAVKVGGFREFNIFDMRDNRMEYEANVFAAQVELDDDEFLEYCNMGYDIQQIAMAMNSDINLVALKTDILISQGYRLQKQEHKSNFLKYDK